MAPRRWIGVDFDGTLAMHRCPWPDDPFAVGDPIWPMVERVKTWLNEGKDIRIFTARMDCYHPTVKGLTAAEVRAPIEAWCLKYFGRVLPITNRKDYWCDAIYDDRAFHVRRDIGTIVEEN